MTNSTDVPASKAKPDYAEIVIACVTGLALAITAVFICVVPITNISGSRDFVAFWATGQQLAHHANPYDGAAMGQIERSAGLPAKDGVMYMRNLPWSLPMAFPLGFLGLRAAAFLWSLIQLACLLLSVRLLWRMNGSPSNYLYWLGLSFQPALLCLMMGQTTLFALTGYVLFLYLHQSRPFLTGISLWLCVLKPHLFLPFGIALLAWILFTKNYKMLGGLAAAMTASCAAAFCIDPAAWSEYFRMMKSAGIVDAHMPCLSVALRFWIAPHIAWFSWLPVILGCVWALGYFSMRRATWDWMREGNLVMLVSLLTAPYSWVYDDSLAMPALMHGAHLTRVRALLAIAALASLAIEIELFTGVKIYSSFYLWTTPTWLLWYLCAIKFRKNLTADTDQRDAAIAG